MASKLHSSKLDRDLTALRDDVLRLGDMTDKAIFNSVRILRELDVAGARELIANDAQINRFRFQIEQRCHLILAMQQPTARDLRTLVTTIHIVVELERIADHAAGIAKLTIQLANGYVFPPVPEITTMKQISRHMLKASLDAYQNWDANLARQTFRRDDEVDKLDKRACEKLVASMTEEKRHIECGTYLLWVVHNLERIADRITNICERVIYMVTGELVIEDEG